MKKLKNHTPLTHEEIRELEQRIKMAKVKLLVNELNSNPPKPVDGKCPNGWYFENGICILDS